MAEYRLAPTFACGGAAPLLARHGAVTITERPDLALAALAQRAGDAALEALVRDVTGAPLPGPGRISGQADGVQLAWTGPGQWLALAPADRHPDLAWMLVARLGAAASVTDQAGGWVCLDLDGVGCTALLERLCPLDTGAMDAGRAERTGIEHMGCLVICEVPGQRYRVMAARSFAVSLADMLETVARGLV